MKMNSVLVGKNLPTGQILQIVQGDIILEEVDAIVNAANEHLGHGGGVARAISNKGGSAIQTESDEWIRKHGPVSHAHPAWTSGGALPAKYVIHAVGPVWGNTHSAGTRGGEDSKLADAIYGSLRVADELQCSSIALPAISTGIFGFPKERAARVILNSIQEYTKKERTGLKTIRVTLFDKNSADVFMQALTEL